MPTLSQTAGPQVNFARAGTPRTPKKRWKVIVGVVCGLLLLFAVLGIASYQPARRAMAAASDGQTNFLEAQSAFEAQDFSAAVESLDRANAKFETAVRELKILTWVRVIPILERQHRAATHLLNAGLKTGQSVAQVARFGQTTIEPFRANGRLSLASLTTADKREILKRMTESQPVLATARADVDEAVAELDRVPASGLVKPLRLAVEPLRAKLPIVKTVIDEVASLSRTIPLLAGYPDERTYLFLLENNTELRPAGGFIGTYGVLRVQSGEIESFSTDNIYNLDVPAEAFLNVEPPEPLKKYLKSERWFLRDSNWSPHFPESAEKALWFYEQERGPVAALDGVIAVTPTFIESLIELTGSLTVQGVTFTKENFIDTLQYQVEKGYYRQGIDESERKEVIGSLAQLLLERLLALPQSEWDDLWKTFIEDVERKQILIYLKDPTLQATIEDENWGGVVTDTPGDYLLVVDANMAALKSDPGVKRSIDYSISLDGRDAYADLTVTYRNEGTISWKSTRYRTYSRFYVPKGSQLLESSGFLTNDKLQNGRPAEALVGEELGKTVFAGFTSVEPQSSGQLHLRYRLPDDVAQILRARQYVLHVQKQPGSATHELAVTVDGSFRPKKLLPAELESTVDGNAVTFIGALGRDLQFSVTD